MFWKISDTPTFPFQPSLLIKTLPNAQRSQGIESIESLFYFALLTDVPAVFFSSYFSFGICLETYLTNTNKNS